MKPGAVHTGGHLEVALRNLGVGLVHEGGDIYENDKGNRIAITGQVSTIKSVGQEMVHLGMRSKLAHELIFIFPLP